jgi:glutamate/tyrosine decarboxylase-like PLP-dependent enzyme
MQNRSNSEVAMDALLHDAAGRAIGYLSALHDRPVAPAPEALAALRALATPLPDAPTDPAAVLRILDETASPATTAMAGPRFFGFVVGGSLPAALAANWLAGAWDQKTAFRSVAPATATLEEVSLGWLVDVFGLPDGTAAGFTTGATVANLTTLASARHQVLSQAGWDVEGDGLFGAPPITVVVGDEVHPSLVKALGILGLGRNRIVRVPVDDQGRMRAAEMPRLAGPTIVCAQAGNVNTGAIDPLGEICDRAEESGAWVHVDGAFGLWATAVPSLQGLTAGVENADSWATDAHKWLNVPYDSGLAFVRDPDALRAAMSISAEYLPPAGGQRNPSDYTPEMSRRGRGVEVWAALMSLGRSGLVELIERNCRLARRFATELSAAGFAILNDVVLNQVLVSFGDVEVTDRIVAAIQDDGTCWCGGTVWHGKPAMRISVSSWATTDDDVTRSVEAIINAAQSELSGRTPG